MEMYDIADDGYSAKISAMGAELKSFRNDSTNVEYIWYADPKYWSESAPWLFPVVCDLRNHETVIDGRIYHIDIHGFASRMLFEVVEHRDNLLRMRLSDSPETLCQYPFRFVLEICYVLTGGRLDMTLTVTNPNDRAMPFFIGGHFGINCPMFAGERFEDMTVVFERDECLSLPTLDPEKRVVLPGKENMRFEGRTLRLDYDLFNHDALMFDKLQSRSVELVNPDGRGIRVAFPDFQMLGVWTWPKKHAPYVCIEPWNGIGTYSDEDDIFEHKRCVQYAQSNATRSYRLSICEIG